MKTIVPALFASVCALGAFAGEITAEFGTNTYTFAYTDGDDGKVTLTEIKRQVEGAPASGRWAEPDFDMTAIQKLFSEEGQGLRIVGLEEDLDCYFEDTSAITSVVLSEYLSDDAVKALRDSLDGLETFSGFGNEFSTADGLVYVDGGRTLLTCPKARAGAVKLPGNCRAIKSHAFYGCRNLTGVSGGAEVMRVDENAFGDLKDQDGLPPFIADAEDGVVMVCRAVIGWKGESDPPATVTLPAGATSIASKAFPGSVTGVEGGMGVVWVGPDVLPGLVPNSPAGDLVMVGRVLMGCNGNITELTPPSDTVMIAPQAFLEKFSLETLNLSGLDLLEVIGDQAFSYCSFTSVELPDSLKEVGSEAFANCGVLEKFTFGKATAKLGAGTFRLSPGLAHVYFRCEQAPTVDQPERFHEGFPHPINVHAMIGSTGWELDGDGRWYGHDFYFDMRRDAVTGYVGYYDKWMLTELGVDVPPAGTVYSAVAYGLPKGLVLKANAAKKNKKGKVVTPAKTSWWIEGVPTTTLDRLTQTAFVKTTVNGVSTLQPIDLEVKEEPAILDFDLSLKKFVVKKPGEYGLDKGWTMSNLPKGLTQAKKAIKVKVGRKQYSVPAYGIHGAPTVPGNYIVTAKKKTGSWYEVRKYRYRVLNADGTPVEDDPVISKTPVELKFNYYDDINDYDGTRQLSIQGGLRKDGGESVIHEFTAEPGAKLTLSGAPATLKLIEEIEGSGNWKLVGFANPGDYHVSVVATLDGLEDSRQSVIVNAKSLPDWATGSFIGYVGGPDHEDTLWGAFTMSVTAKGEISGKLDRDGENYSFKVDSYAASDDRSFSATNIVLQQSVLRRVYDSKKKKWAMVKVMEDTEMRLDVKVEQGLAGVLAGYMYSEGEPDDGDIIVAQQNRWGTTYKNIGIALFTASAKQKYKTFTIKSGYGLDEGASLSFKITPSGSVTVTGKFPSGWKTVKQNGRKVKVRTYVTKTRATMLMPETAPDVGAAGFRGRIPVSLLFFSEGRFMGNDHIFDFPFEAECTSWFTGEFNTPACVATLTRSVESATQPPYAYTYGTCNVKVKDSLAFTGTFTSAGIGSAVSFSGTLKGVESDGQGAVGTPVETNQYVAETSIIWNGWRIPFTLRLEKDTFGNFEVGRPTFNTYAPDQSAPDAMFFSAEHVADNYVGGLPAAQEIWRWDRYESDGRTHLGNIWPEAHLYDEAAVLDPGGIVEWDVDDWLVYRYRSNGSVSIDGVIGGQTVKTSSVVQFVDWADSGYSGCFFVNLGAAGLFVQKCNIEMTEEERPFVKIGNAPLEVVWRKPE